MFVDSVNNPLISSLTNFFGLRGFPAALSPYRIFGHIYNPTHSLPIRTSSSCARFIRILSKMQTEHPTETSVHMYQNTHCHIKDACAHFCSTSFRWLVRSNWRHI
jgi:hypothetical protein